MCDLKHKSINPLYICKSGNCYLKGDDSGEIEVDK
jgi:hypothetical protein